MPPPPSMPPTPEQSPQNDQFCPLFCRENCEHNGYKPWTYRGARTWRPRYEGIQARVRAKQQQQQKLPRVFYACVAFSDTLSARPTPFFVTAQDKIVLPSTSSPPCSVSPMRNDHLFPYLIFFLSSLKKGGAVRSRKQGLG